MARNYLKVGLSNVGSYEVSGQPWVSGGINAASEIKLQFPMVTRWIQIRNNDASNEAKVGFSSLGVNGKNYFTIPTSTTSEVLELKVTTLHLLTATDVDVLAGLTNIPRGTINNPSNSPAGTNWSGSYVSSSWSPGI